MANKVKETEKISATNKKGPVENLSSGYNSKTVKEYDPSKTEGQIGKEHEEAVAPKNNWKNDKRDGIGRAAKNISLAKKLRRIAREIEAIEMDENYDEKIKEVKEVAEEVINASTESKEGIIEDLGYVANNDEEIIKEAIHPIEHNPANDNPGANMSSQTGDDQWIELGEAEFNDNRDQVEKAK